MFGQLDPAHRRIAQGFVVLGFVYLASVGLFGPIVGGLLHFVGPLFVICNSARLLGFGQTKG